MPGQRIRVHLQLLDSLFEAVISSKKKKTKLLFDDGPRNTEGLVGPGD